MRGKTRAQFVHARRRCAERYGLNLTRKDVKNICDQIKSGRATHIQTQSHRVSLFDVGFKGDIIRVAYDSLRKSIATCLPKINGVGYQSDKDTQVAYHDERRN